VADDDRRIGQVGDDAAVVVDDVVDPVVGDELGVRASRLYRALVETQLAVDAGSSYRPAIDPTLFDVGLTLRPDVRPDRAEAAVLAELARLAEEPIDAAAIVAPEETALEGASDSEPAAPGDEDDEKAKSDFRRLAERRVRLGLLLAEVGRNNNITVSQEELNQALMQEARRLPYQPV